MISTQALRKGANQGRARWNRFGESKGFELFSVAFDSVSKFFALDYASFINKRAAVPP